MSDGPENSPNMLDERRGVRRLNRVPLIIAGVMILAILAAVTYTYQMRLAEMRRQAAANTARPEAATPAEIFKDAPDGGYIPAKTQTPAAPEKTPPPPARAIPAPEKPDDPNARAWANYQQELQRLRQARGGAMLKAIRASTGIGGGRKPARGAKPAGSADGATSVVGGQLTALYARELLRRRHSGDGEDTEKDINRAAEKQAWLGSRKPTEHSAHYLPGGREAPRSPYEIKAGTVIPAVMIGGISSDLPGQIIGQVAENVYDTATGRYILIPQGARLIGTYDNAVTHGQERVLVAWTRIIYPDASSIDLGKMPGTDSAGLAGFHDQVDTHFWKAFGNALMMSVFSAGVQLSQGNGNSTNGMNAQQTIAAGLGQQLGQLGQEMARRNVRVQPTLNIRPGYQFTVMVTKDMAVARPWRRRKASTD